MKIITDEEVELEIEQLRNDPDVKLAQKERRLKIKRRRYLYDLRQCKKRGAELRESGITFDNARRNVLGR